MMAIDLCAIRVIFFNNQCDFMPKNTKFQNNPRNYLLKTTPRDNHTIRLMIFSLVVMVEGVWSITQTAENYDPL